MKYFVCELLGVTLKLFYIYYYKMIFCDHRQVVRTCRGVRENVGSILSIQNVFLLFFHFRSSHEC